MRLLTFLIFLISYPSWSLSLDLTKDVKRTLERFSTAGRALELNVGQSGPAINILSLDGKENFVFSRNLDHSKGGSNFSIGGDSVQGASSPSMNPSESFYPINGGSKGGEASVPASVFLNSPSSVSASQLFSSTGNSSASVVIKSGSLKAGQYAQLTKRALDNVTSEEALLAQTYSPDGNSDLVTKNKSTVGSGSVDSGSLIASRGSPSLGGAFYKNIGESFPEILPPDSKHDGKDSSQAVSRSDDLDVPGEKSHSAETPSPSTETKSPPSNPPPNPSSHSPGQTGETVTTPNESPETKPKVEPKVEPTKTEQVFSYHAPVTSPTKSALLSNADVGTIASPPKTESVAAPSLLEPSKTQDTTGLLGTGSSLNLFGMSDSSQADSFLGSGMFSGGGLGHETSSMMKDFRDNSCESAARMLKDDSNIQRVLSKMDSEDFFCFDAKKNSGITKDSIKTKLDYIKDACRGFVAVSYSGLPNSRHPNVVCVNFKLSAKTPENQRNYDLLKITLNSIPLGEEENKLIVGKTPSPEIATGDLGKRKFDSEAVLAGAGTVMQQTPKRQEPDTSTPSGDQKHDEKQTGVKPISSSPLPSSSSGLIASAGDPTIGSSFEHKPLTLGSSLTQHTGALQLGVGPIDNGTSLNFPSRTVSGGAGRYGEPEPLKDKIENLGKQLDGIVKTKVDYYTPQAKKIRCEKKALEFQLYLKPNLGFPMVENHQDFKLFCYRTSVDKETQYKIADIQSGCEQLIAHGTLDAKGGKFCIYLNKLHNLKSENFQNENDKNEQLQRLESVLDFDSQSAPENSGRHTSS
jgi:hypothetical protein